MYNSCEVNGKSPAGLLWRLVLSKTLIMHVGCMLEEEQSHAGGDEATGLLTPTRLTLKQTKDRKKVSVVPCGAEEAPADLTMLLCLCCSSIIET